MHGRKFARALLYNVQTGNLLDIFKSRMLVFNSFTPVFVKIICLSSKQTCVGTNSSFIIACNKRKCYNSRSRLRKWQHKTESV